MFDERVSPERLAMLVHHYREALAPDFGVPINTSSEWNDLPAREQHRMVAAVRLALMDLRSSKLKSGPVSAPQTMDFAVAGSEGKECGS